MTTNITTTFNTIALIEGVHRGRRGKKSLLTHSALGGQGSCPAATGPQLCTCGATQALELGESLGEHTSHRSWTWTGRIRIGEEAFKIASSTEGWSLFSLFHHPRDGIEWNGRGLQRPGRPTSWKRVGGVPTIAMEVEVEE